MLRKSAVNFLSCHEVQSKSLKQFAEAIKKLVRHSKGEKTIRGFKGITFTILIAGDLKWLNTITGLNGCNAKQFCILCNTSKIGHGAAPRAQKRTAFKNRIGQNGQKHEPIIDILPADCGVDILHAFLRFADILIDELLKEVIYKGDIALLENKELKITDRTPDSRFILEELSVKTTWVARNFPQVCTPDYYCFLILGRGN